MFVAHSSRTMANARPKFRQDDTVVVNIFEMRRQRAEEARKQEALDRVRRMENHQMAIRAAGDAIRAANAVLAKQRTGYSPISIERIMRLIARACKVQPAEIRSQTRNRDVVFARQAVIYWAYRRTRLSMPEIGRALGGRDHTTILHGTRAYPKKRAEMGRHLGPAR